MGKGLRICIGIAGASAILLLIAVMIWFAGLIFSADAAIYQTTTPSIAGLQAFGTSSPTISHAYVEGVGPYDWIAGACTPDTTGNTIVAATGVPTSGAGAGCWFTSQAVFLNTSQMLSAYGVSDTPPLLLRTNARDSYDTKTLGGAYWNYDSTIQAPFTATASFSVNLPGDYYMTVTATSGTILAGSYINTGSCDGRLNYILPYGTNGRTGTGGTGTYATLLPMTCASGTVTITQDNGGEVRIDPSGHGFRAVNTTAISFELFGNQAATQSLINANAQNAATNAFARVCIGSSPRTNSPLYLQHSFTMTAPLGFDDDGPLNRQCNSIVLAGTPGGDNPVYGENTITFSGFSNPNYFGIDWSGMEYFRTQNIAFYDGTGGPTVLAAGTSIGNTSTLINNSIQTTTYIGPHTYFDIRGNANAQIPLELQQEDLSQIDQTAYFWGNTSLASTAPVYAMAAGGVSPYTLIPGAAGVAGAGAYGVAAGGTATTLTLASNASSVNNIYDNLPILICQSNTSGTCSGTLEAAVFSSYNGSTKTGTFAYPLGGFTPTSSSAYLIGIGGSELQPYAGLGQNGYCTHYEFAGSYSGGIWHTGCDRGASIDFGRNTFFSGVGNPGAVIYIDGGNVCVSANNYYFDNINWENDGYLNGTFAFGRGNFLNDSFTLSGRLAADSTSFDAFFRANQSDVTASPCNVGGAYGSTLGTVNISSSTLGGASINLFDLYPSATSDNVVNSLTLNNSDVTTSPAIGSLGTNAVTGLPGYINDCQIISANILPQSYKPYCQNMQFKGSDGYNYLQQSKTGTSYVFSTNDIGFTSFRSNSGSAMTDTLPAASAIGMQNGRQITITNSDASANDTVSAGASTYIEYANGTAVSSIVVEPGRNIILTLNASGYWQLSSNSDTACLFAPDTTLTPGDYVAVRTAHGGCQDNGPVLNNVMGSDNTDIVGTNYVSLYGGGAVTATETRGQVVPFAQHITTFSVSRITAPGAGNTVTYTLRDNGANTAATITLSGTATTGNWTGSVALAANDLVDISITLSSLGTTSAAGWGLTSTRP